ncbi:MAG: hypothetical protein JWM27_2010 [Gemmatimonadetes bacterium]|nr:hypothetical protein [Gemmatimonadota bacterium]
MARSILAASLLGLLALSAPLRAQSVDSVTPPRRMAARGEKVRMTAPLAFRGWKAGTLERADGDSVLIDLEHGGGRLAVARWQVEAMERAHGRNRVTGAMRGLGIGLAVAAVPLGVKEAEWARRSTSRNDDGVAAIVIGELGIIAGFVGLLGGAAVGVQGWEKVDLPPVNVAPQPGTTAADRGSFGGTAPLVTPESGPPAADLRSYEKAR